MRSHVHWAANKHVSVIIRSRFLHAMAMWNNLHVYLPMYLLLFGSLIALYADVRHYNLSSGMFWYFLIRYIKRFNFIYTYLEFINYYIADWING